MIDIDSPGKREVGRRAVTDEAEMITEGRICTVQSILQSETVGHFGSVHECSSPFTNCQSARFKGTGIPNFSPRSAMAPLRKSTSVSRFADTSMSILTF